MPSLNEMTTLQTRHTLTLMVPCYNEETTLAHCVERVLELNSEFLNLEISLLMTVQMTKALKLRSHWDDSTRR